MINVVNKILSLLLVCKSSSIFNGVKK